MTAQAATAGQVAPAPVPLARTGDARAWEAVFASRALGMTTSEIRALFSVASRPEVVSLAGGMPYVTALPLEAVAARTARLIAEQGASALQYSSGQGDPGLREQICDVMTAVGVRAAPESVVVTVGSQQALDLVARLFLDPGDVVLVESPSYVGALSVFAQYQASVVHVPCDDDGLRPDALADVLAAQRAAGRRVKLLYTVPNHHNPAGVTLAEDRRDAVLDVCDRDDVTVVEDDPYGLLGFDGEPLRALRARDERVLHLGSFSKTFAAGLRVGWVCAPPAVRDKLVLAMEASVLCPPAFTQAVVREYLVHEPWREQVKTFRELYRERRDALLGALDALWPPGSTWTRPGGGFFVWLTLPEGVDTTAMLSRAVQARVAFVPGAAFFADGSGRSSMRLSYCYPPAERIVEGVRRLSAVVSAETELMATFGASAAGHPHAGPSTPTADLA